MPAFSFVIDTAVWQMETNCTVKASEWQGAGECQTWRWKTMKREPQVFVGDSDPTDPGIKYLLKRRRKGRTGFRQAAVKLGELTMAALFLAGDMGWGGGGGWGGSSDSPENLCSGFLKWLQTEYVTSSQGLTQPCVERRKTNNKWHFLKILVVTLVVLC